MKQFRLFIFVMMLPVLAWAGDNKDHQLDDPVVYVTDGCSARAPITQFPNYMTAVPHPGLWIASSDYWYEAFTDAFLALQDQGYDVVNNHDLLKPYIGGLLEDYLYQEETDNEHANYELIGRLVNEYALPRIEAKYLGKRLETLSRRQWQQMILDVNGLFHPYFTHPGYKAAWRTSKLVVFSLVIKRGNFRGYLQDHKPELLPAFNSLMKKYTTSKSTEDMLQMEMTPDEQFLLDEYVYLPPSAGKIQVRMNAFLNNLKSRIEANEDAIETAAYAHMELVRIHPFADANGRTARIIMNMVLMDRGYPPVVFLRESTYAEAVKRDAKVPGTFACYLRKKVAEIDSMPLDSNPYAIMSALEEAPETLNRLKDLFKHYSQNPSDCTCDQEELLPQAI